MISAWVLLGPTVHAAKKNRDATPEGEEYTGPMDDRSYAILNTFVDSNTVQGMYKVKGSGPNAFTLYALKFRTVEQATDDLTYLDEAWPNPMVDVYGMWEVSTGVQVGTEGVPTYAIPSDCYKVMADIVTYDDDGNETSRTVASSNADLRDENLLCGQAPRIFV